MRTYAVLMEVTLTGKVDVTSLNLLEEEISRVPFGLGFILIAASSLCCTISFSPFSLT